ncbi:hypothetical protein QF001_006104 [Paraburkholderia youngii]
MAYSGLILAADTDARAAFCGSRATRCGLTGTVGVSLGRVKHAAARSVRQTSKPASGRDEQQNQPEQHHDEPPDTNLMRRSFRYFTERVAPGARKNERKHPLDNQHQRDREQ